MASAMPGLSPGVLKLSAHLSDGREAFSGWREADGRPPSLNDLLQRRRCQRQRVGCRRNQLRDRYLLQYGHQREVVTKQHRRFEEVRRLLEPMQACY